MKKISLILVVAMVLSLFSMGVEATGTAPDYANIKSMIKLENNATPDDVSSFVEKPFEIVDGYGVNDGEQRGYYVVKDDDTLTLTNTAPSDEYVMYLTLVPHFNEGNGVYTNALYYEDDDAYYNEFYHYCGDGKYIDFEVPVLYDEDVVKIHKGESVTFKIPDKIEFADYDMIFSNEVMWAVVVSTVHGKYEMVDDGEGGTYKEFVQTEGDTGWRNWWFIKVDNAAVNEKLVGANVNTPFADVKATDYFNGPIKWAIAKGITNGTSATTFSPNSTCTQAQILTFLWRANGSPVVSGNLDWVDNNAYYANALKWAASKNIIKGKINPNAPCTRIETVRFLYLLLSGDEGGIPGMADEMTDLSEADKETVAWAIAKGITNGTSPTTFSPNSTCTRGQIITFLCRAF